MKLSVPEESKKNVWSVSLTVGRSKIYALLLLKYVTLLYTEVNGRINVYRRVGRHLRTYPRKPKVC
jgi:hypothetical protein